MFRQNPTTSFLSKVYIQNEQNLQDLAINNALEHLSAKKFEVF